MKLKNQLALGIALAVSSFSGPAFAFSQAVNYTDLSSVYQWGGQVQTTWPDFDESMPANSWGDTYSLVMYGPSFEYEGEAGVRHYSNTTSILSQAFIEWMDSNGTLWYSGSQSALAAGTAATFKVGYDYAGNGNITNGHGYDFTVLSPSYSFANYKSLGISGQSVREISSRVSSQDGCSSKVSGFAHRFYGEQYQGNANANYYADVPNNTNYTTYDATYHITGDASGSFASGGSVYLMTHSY